MTAASIRVDHGWYAELGTRDSALIAFVEQGHETVPVAAGGAPAGVLVTFHVDDAEPPYLRAIDTGWPVLVDLVSELGQRHFMITDPDRSASPAARSATTNTSASSPPPSYTLTRLATVRASMPMDRAAPPLRCR